MEVSCLRMTEDDDQPWACPLCGETFWGPRDSVALHEKLRIHLAGMTGPHRLRNAEAKAMVAMVFKGQPTWPRDEDKPPPLPGAPRPAPEPPRCFCRDCGAFILAKAEICPKCGCRQREVPRTRYDEELGPVRPPFPGDKMIFLVAFNILCAGLGNIIFGDRRGWLYALITAVAAVIWVPIAMVFNMAGLGPVLLPVYVLSFAFGVFCDYQGAQFLAGRVPRNEDAGVLPIVLVVLGVVAVGFVLLLGTRGCESRCERQCRRDHEACLARGLTGNLRPLVEAACQEQLLYCANACDGGRSRSKARHKERYFDDGGGP